MSVTLSSVGEMNTVGRFAPFQRTIDVDTKLVPKMEKLGRGTRARTEAGKREITVGAGFGRGKFEGLRRSCQQLVRCVPVQIDAIG